MVDLRNNDPELFGLLGHGIFRGRHGEQRLGCTFRKHEGATCVVGTACGEVPGGLGRALPSAKADREVLLRRLRQDDSDSCGVALVAHRVINGQVIGLVIADGGSGGVAARGGAERQYIGNAGQDLGKRNRQSLVAVKRVIADRGDDNPAHPLRFAVDGRQIEGCLSVGNCLIVSAFLSGVGGRTQLEQDRKVGARLQRRQGRIAVHVDVEMRVLPLPGRVSADHPEAVDVVVVHDREERLGPEMVSHGCTLRKVVVAAIGDPVNPHEEGLVGLLAVVVDSVDPEARRVLALGEREGRHFRPVTGLAAGAREVVFLNSEDINFVKRSKISSVYRPGMSRPATRGSVVKPRPLNAAEQSRCSELGAVALNADADRPALADGGVLVRDPVARGVDVADLDEADGLVDDRFRAVGAGLEIDDAPEVLRVALPLIIVHHQDRRHLFLGLARCETDRYRRGDADIIPGRAGAPSIVRN